jgi:hypothetical protein
MVADMSERSWRVLAGTYLTLLSKGQKLLQSVPDGIASSSALNTAVRLVTSAHEGLHNLGLWVPPPEDERTTELIIRSFTEEEEIEIRQRAEEHASGNQAEPAIGSGSSAAHSCPTPPPTLNRFYVKETLPSERKALEPWLTVIGERYGRVFLGQIAETLGGKGAGDRADLIAEIIALTNGDVTRLEVLREPIADC